MNNPVTTIVGQHLQQRPVLVPHGPSGLQPGSITLLRHAIPPRHEPESHQLSHTTSNQTTPLVRSTNTDYGTPIHLHDGLLARSDCHPPAEDARMYPMVRRPRPDTRAQSARGNAR